MDVVILAGGLGTRIAEETVVKPKPLIEIGGKPILWHIMKLYSHYGCNNFIICLGYKGFQIKEYFTNYFLYNSDVTIDLANNSTEIHKNSSDPWKVTLVDTGEHSMTGGRIKRVKDFIASDDFLLTYGDGVSDVNIGKLIEFHRSHGNDATLTGVYPPGRFGVLQIEEENRVTAFKEKPEGDGACINGGFFVLNKKIISYIDNDDIIFERQPLERLASEKQLRVFQHQGFWHPMDTLRDKQALQALWETGQAPWKVW